MAIKARNAGRTLARSARFIARHWFALAILTLLVCCACFGARSTGHAIHRGAVAIGREVLPLAGDLVVGAWSLVIGVVGA